MPMFEATTVLPISPASARTTRLSFRLVTDARELETLAPAWQGLLDASAEPEPMLAPAWLLTWWRVYGQASGRRLRVGLFHDGDRLVGLAPLCQRRYWHRPGIPMSRLEFLGGDVDEQDGVCSEYLGLIARAGQEERVQDQFVDEVQRGSFGSWHELVLEAMNGALPGAQAMQDAFAARGHHVRLQTTTESPFLTLPSSWDAYLKGLPKKKRHFLTSAMRAFEAWAGSDWKIEEVRTADDLTRGQQILWELHHHRWHEGDGSAGVFASQRFAAFHQAYMPRLLSEGKLDLFWLSVRGQPIAVNYEIIAAGKAYYYQTGRRLDLPNNVRAGIIIVSLAVQRAMARGLREFDFLGGPAQYKAQFTQTSRPIVSLRVARQGVHEWLRQRAEKAIDWLRDKRNRFRQWRQPAAVMPSS